METYVLQRLRFQKSFGQEGVAHFIIPTLVFVAFFGIAGGYYMLRASHAAVPGTVYIKSAIAGKCLDDWHHNTKPGGPVDSYGCNQTIAQQWMFNANGTVSVANSDLCLAPSTAASTSPIIMSTCSSTAKNQQWMLKDLTTGANLVNVATRNCLTVPNSSTVAGVHVVLATCSSTAKGANWTTEAVAANANAAPKFIDNFTNVTANAATVTWSTDEYASGVITYYTGNSAKKTLSSSQLLTRHTVTISGLTAGSTYTYQIAAKNSVGKMTVSATKTFTTSSSIKPPVPPHGGGGKTVGSISSGAFGCSQTLTGSNLVSLGNGEVHLQSNEWDSKAPYSICTDGGNRFKITSSQISQSGGPPGAYPSLIIGCHWTTNNCTTGNPFPIALSAMPAEKVTSSYNTSITTNSDAWDDAYDIWFNSNARAGSNNNNGDNGAGSLELMVWLNHAGGVGPAGGDNQVGTYTMNGTTFNIFYNKAGTISYVAQHGISSITNMDLGALAANAMKYTNMKPSWSLLDVEAGFEVWHGGVGLTVNGLSVTVH